MQNFGKCTHIILSFLLNSLKRIIQHSLILIYLNIILVCLKHYPVNVSNLARRGNFLPAFPVRLMVKHIQ